MFYEHLERVMEEVPRKAVLVLLSLHTVHQLTHSALDTSVAVMATAVSCPVVLCDATVHQVALRALAVDVVQHDQTVAPAAGRLVGGHSPVPVPTTQTHHSALA